MVAKSAALFCLALAISLLIPSSRILACAHGVQARPTPAVKRDSLLNGLRLMVIEQPGTKLVEIHLRINSGAMFDLSGKGGLADVTARMVLRGTPGINAKALTELANQLGLSISAKVGWDASDFVVAGPAADFEQIADTLARIVINPAFDQKELDTLKAEKVSGLLTRNLSDGDRLTQTALTLFYGAFPYGHPIEGTADSISRITRDDIVSYHSRFYIANNAAVVIQGDVTAAQVTNVARAKFGVWEKNDVVAATFRPPSPLEGSQIFISDQPSANQAVAVICQGGASRKAHDYLAAELMAAMIPPVASGELSVPGLKIESTLDGRVLPGPLTLQITAPADKLTAAVNSVRSVMARIAAGDVPADQLDRAKQRLIESFSASLNAPEATAVELLDIEEYDLGRDYFLNYVDRVNAVSMADIANSAHKYLTPGSLVIGIDGPASQIEGPMKKVGAVSIVR